MFSPYSVRENIQNPTPQGVHSIIQLPNNWTLDKINIVFKWRQQSRVYHWLHAKASAYKNWWYVRIFYTSAVFTMAGLGQNFGTFFTEGSDSYRILQITNAIILVLIGVLNIYLKTSKVAELSEKHSNTSKNFYALQTEIEEQLSQSPEDREDGKIYIKKIRVKITSLIKESPEIQQSVWDQFTKAIKNKEIFNESDPTMIYTNAETLAKMESGMTADKPIVSNVSNDVMLPYELPTKNETKIDIRDSLSPRPSDYIPNSIPSIRKAGTKSPVSQISNISHASQTSDQTSEKTNEQKDEKTSTLSPKAQDIQNEFVNSLTYSGKIEPNVLKALDYQMARFN